MPIPGLLATRNAGTHPARDPGWGGTKRNQPFVRFASQLPSVFPLK